MTTRNFFAFLMLTACSLALGQNIDITVEGTLEHMKVPVYRVAVTSADADMAATAKRAFSTHGSYVLTTPQKAQFTFDFEPAGANAVSVTIKGGTVFKQTCTGSDPVNALLKACDLAVLKTINTPGYFAGKLAFSYSQNLGKTSEICVSDMVFKNVRSITRDKSDSLMPHISPDGRKIIYTGYYRAGFMDLYLIDLASNTRKVFANFKGSNTGGAFSPDGSKVAVVLTSSGNAEIWTANASGGGFKKLTTTDATESSPSFSPDGRRMVFASDRRGFPQIYVMPSTGGKMQVVPTNLSRYCSEPSWNPADANKIVLTVAQGRGFQVAVYDLSTRQGEVVSSGISTSGASWLNDGRHIVCTKSNGKNRQLYIVDTATKKQTALHTPGFGSAQQPDFVYVK